jgi:prolyl-tRNA editing enzyme YbaK/EbsC (Cys-tRNA(Pro) deacylase)
VDTALVADALGITVLRKATPDEVRDATGQPIGGVSPIGHPAPVRALIDPSLRQHPTIWAAAGTPHAVFSSTYDELRRLASADEVAVAAP